MKKFLKTSIRRLLLILLLPIISVFLLIVSTADFLMHGLVGFIFEIVEWYKLYKEVLFDTVKKFNKVW